MFIQLRVMAHDALKTFLLDINHTPLYDKLTRTIYNAISKAETDDAFAQCLDNVCADAFAEQTAEGYDDLIELFADPTRELRDLLTRYGLMEKED